VASIASVPNQVRIALFDGLVSLRPFAAVLICVVIFQALTSYRYGWRPWSSLTVLLGTVAMILLLRSVWPLIWSEPEPVFVDKTYITGSPSWEGATHSKGLVTSLLLISYVALAVVVATLVRQTKLGERLAKRAANTLVWSITGFALLFLVFLARSVVVDGLNPALWSVVIRGIDVSRSGSDQSLLGIGPDEGVIFAAGAVLAGSLAAFNKGHRFALGFATLLQLAASLMSFSRGAWLAAFIGFLLLLLICSRTSRLLIAPYCVFCGGLFILLMLVIQSLQGDAIARLVLGISGGTTDARLQQWQVLSSFLLQQPLLGYGAEGYRPFTAGFPAESFLLEMAFSGGLVILMLWVASQVSIWGLFARRLGTLRREADGIVIPVAVSFASFTLGTMFNTSGWTPVYWVLMGLVIGLLQRSDRPAVQHEWVPYGSTRRSELTAATYTHR
jgi:O-antigen ligase